MNWYCLIGNRNGVEFLCHLANNVMTTPDLESIEQDCAYLQSIYPDVTYRIISSRDEEMDIL